MEVKLFEIRDRATFIPAIAVRLFVNFLDFKDPADKDAELFLLRRAGYSLEQLIHRHAEPYILLSKLDGVRAEHDPYNWDSDTMKTAHNQILLEWDELKSGDVIDAEFIRGESLKPKQSERFFIPL